MLQQELFEGNPLYLAGNVDSPIWVLQIISENEVEFLEEQESLLAKELENKVFYFLNILIPDWNQNLSPWEAPAVFGKEGFGSGAKETLAWIEEKLLPHLLANDAKDKTFVLAGYSLAGLFALWAGTQQARFAGIVAGSPSLWFPKFVDYVRDNAFHISKVYVSLGDAEAKTKNQIMQKVAENTETVVQIVKDKGVDCVFEWNAGNHFKDVAGRMARGIGEMLSRLRAQE